MGADRAERVAAELLALAELELELVTAGRATDLADLHDRRDAALAQLPGELAPGTRDTLRLALGVQRQAAVTLAGALAEGGRERLAGPRPHRRPRLHAAGLDPRRVLDRTA